MSKSLWQQVLVTLQGIQREKSTGRLIVMGKVGSDARQQAYSVCIDRGEPTDMRLISRPIPISLNDLLALILTRTGFPKSLKVSKSTSAVMPNMQELIEQVEQKAGAVESNAAILTIDLVFEAQKVLATVYGSQAAAQVQQIRQRFDPLTKPQAFLAECRSTAANMVGMQMAVNMFAALQAQI